MKKRILALLLAVVTLFCFASCDTKPAGDASSEEEAGPYPVIIIPGIMGSELMKEERKIWLGEYDDTVAGGLMFISDFLSLQVDETGKGDGSITPVRFCMSDYEENTNVGTQGTYTALAVALAEDLGEENVWFFGYDWRLDNRDTAEELNEYISQVLTATGAKKVNIVAHSMGGFVTSCYLSSHGNEGLVDRVVTCGTPFLGAEDATQTLKNGNGFIDFGSILGDQASSLTGIFGSIPALHQLLPTSAYDRLGITADGVLPEDATAAERMGYEYNTRIMANITEIWKDVEHYNFVGKDHETSGEKGKEDGDGTVTYYSATVNGEFAKSNHRLTEFDLDHNELVNDKDAISAVISVVGANSYSNK